MLKLKKIASIVLGGAILFASSAAFSAGTYSVPLPDGAYLAELLVNSSIRGNAEDLNAAPGHYTWMYQTNMRSFASGDAGYEFLLYGDRAFAFNNMGRDGDGYNNFIIRSMPEFLEGAHFLQISNDARNPEHGSVSDQLAPYIVFTAARTIHAYLGVDMRISPDAYLVAANIPNSAWEFLGVDYFIENNETDQLAGNRNPNFFDENHEYEHYGPIRFYLHRMLVEAGQTVAIPTPGTGNPMITLAFVAVGDAPDSAVSPTTDDAVAEASSDDENGEDTTAAAHVSGDSDDSESVSTAIIIALVAGGVVLLLIIIFFVVKKK